MRSEKYGVTGTGQDAAGATAAAGAARGRAADGTGRAPQQDKRAADDALWAQAARWQAADQARRQAAEQARRQARDRKPPSGPAGPAARREPFRPWFADSAGAEPWLTADGTGEPWFAPDGDGER